MARTIAKDHDEKRNRILENAATVFAANGFDGASMSALAKACGISKANIYHYHDSKNALLFDLLENYLSDLRDQACGTDPNLPAEEQLYQFIATVLAAYEGADALHKVQIESLPRLPEAEQRRLRGHQRDMVRHLDGIVRAIAPARLDGDDQKVRQISMSVFGMLNWYYMWGSKSAPSERKDYAKLVGDLSLNGIKNL